MEVLETARLEYRQEDWRCHSRDGTELFIILLYIVQSKPLGVSQQADRFGPRQHPPDFPIRDELQCTALPCCEDRIESDWRRRLRRGSFGVDVAIGETTTTCGNETIRRSQLAFGGTVYKPKPLAHACDSLNLSGGSSDHQSDPYLPSPRGFFPN